jgi:uncharacterized protein (DUF2249 family)
MSVMAEHTVADIARHPGVREVLDEFGINHCCGAHLSLREAAAAAGIELDVLLHALDEPLRPLSMSQPSAAFALDVRGLEPPLPMLRVLEQLESLPAGQTLEITHDRRPLFLYPQLDKRGFGHETDEPEPGIVRIRIRKL